jgi:transposase InsO family protein
MGTGRTDAISQRSGAYSDRGSQYCSHDYQKTLREHGMQSSISSKGNCYINAAVETFFKTIKAELVWRRNWETHRQAETSILLLHQRLL